MYRPEAAPFDRSLKSVVVIGNGIAGVTAADFLRRGHPDCEIHLVGSEAHVLYNRMGIYRLVYGRSAMRGLYLLSESWYDEHGITAWLNTFATQIDTSARRVRLGTGEVLRYDRLILAMGGSSASGAIEGFGLALGPAGNAHLVEQFRRLAATLHRAHRTNGLKSGMVTSAMPGDGSTDLKVFMPFIQ